MIVDADIDIDFADRKQALADLDHVRAALKGERAPHNSAVYFQDIPADPLDGMAVWDYKEAEAKGYFKVDFLNNSIYKGVRDETHLVQLLTREPAWESFEDRLIVERLAHLSRHFDVVRQIKPRSIIDLAVCLAIIRPGKTHLIGRRRAEIDREIWIKPQTDDYHFKRSHAIAYAASIVVQLNLLDDD